MPRMGGRDEPRSSQLIPDPARYLPVRDPARGSAIRSRAAQKASQGCGGYGFSHRHAGTGNSSGVAAGACRPDGVEQDSIPELPERQLGDLYRPGQRSQRINMSNNPAADARPSLDRGVNHVAFNSDRYGNADIFVVNTDGNNLTGLTDNPQMIMRPLGRLIAHEWSLFLNEMETPRYI